MCVKAITNNGGRLSIMKLINGLVCEGVPMTPAMMGCDSYFSALASMKKLCFVGDSNMMDIRRPEGVSKEHSHDSAEIDEIH